MTAVNAVEIADRYRLERRLGYGGMSTVHLALDLRLERQVAVKLLAEHLADDPAFVSRFQREAQAAARLIHPNIVQIFDSGLDERSGQHFIVMEYIEGSSCAEILRDEGWVEVPQAVAIIEQACEGLHYAHRHGVVHRDVKPGNLLRSREGQVKLADFGIAKATEQSSITQVGSVLGTAAYLAPEQARGEDAGPAADLYALGVVSYQLISGRLPYEATSLTELALKQQQEEPPRLDTLVAAVTPELAEAVAIALALDPGERFRNAREMAGAVLDGAHGMPLQAHLSPPGQEHERNQPTQATSLLPQGERGQRRARRTRAETAPTRAAQPLTPRAPERERFVRESAPAAAPSPPARRRSTRRFLTALAALAALAIVVAAIAIATASGPTRITLRNVLESDAEKSAAALKQLVVENTK
jgi:eukaryotic-like serine/threonine-protein kinase